VMQGRTSSKSCNPTIGLSHLLTTWACLLCDYVGCNPTIGLSHLLTNEGTISPPSIDLWLQSHNRAFASSDCERILHNIIAFTLQSHNRAFASSDGENFLVFDEL